VDNWSLVEKVKYFLLFTQGSSSQLGKGGSRSSSSGRFWVRAVSVSDLMSSASRSPLLPLLAYHRVPLCPSFQSQWREVICTRASACTDVSECNGRNYSVTLRWTRSK